MNDRGKLGNFLKEVISWNWKEFCDAEKDPKYSGLQATVLALVRTTSEAKLGAIKLAIDRVDGKLETPVKIEYPKVWYLYPEAKEVAAPEPEDIGLLTDGNVQPRPPIANLDVFKEAYEPEPEPEAVNIATMTLRETLNKMADAPRQVVPLILMKKKEVEADLSKDIENVPLVKSVIAANLLHLAIEKNNFDAITEIFDQIDGKLVETIRILGDDLYLTQYSLVAPYGAKKNKDGIYMIESKEVAELWKQKLSKD